MTVGVDLDFAPIENLGNGGDYIGVTADFLSLISAKTGLRFEIDHKHTWEESLERIRSGRVHMLGAAVPSQQRREFMDFTLPYAWLSGVIIVRKAVTEPMSLEKLKGMSVTVVENYIWRDILEQSHPELILSPAPTIGAALNKVSFGMADAMVGYMATASHHIERLGISNLKISGETVSVLNISFAVSRETPELTSLLNKVVSRTTEAQKKASLRKWISLDLTEQKSLRWVTRV
ncbi:MAG: transporter substrate-binding domain-containing protein, partial [Desulfobacterales bacterium]|nr:transporter substrate-binding domain-containing protein [Desulfobacterales bacterium]